MLLLKETSLYFDASLLWVVQHVDFFYSETFMQSKELHLVGESNKMFSFI